jgi:hypothetical protein
MKPYRFASSAAVAAIVFAMFCLAPIARAQVLQQVPADALVVIKINKLKPVSDKVAALMTKLGAVQAKPELADPLGMLQKEAGLSQGLNANGDAAFVLVHGDMNGAQPPAIMLVPVTDYKAFLGNFPDAKSEGEISTIHLKNNPEDNFVAQWGGYAAISPMKDLLTKKPEGVTAAGFGRQGIGVQGHHRVREHEDGASEDPAGDRAGSGAVHGGAGESRQPQAAGGASSRGRSRSRAGRCPRRRRGESTEVHAAGAHAGEPRDRHRRAGRA